jgi:nucleotide sugar dehydrogenase
LTVRTADPAGPSAAPDGVADALAAPLRLFHDDDPMSDRTGTVSRTGRARIAVVGLGYVGLPTALAFLDAGQEVIGLDVSRSRLEAIRQRRVDLVATDHERLDAWLGSDALELTDEPARLADADAMIICVPTPVDEHRQPDLGALRAACATAVSNAVRGQTILLTSTTYVGSTREMVVEPLRARGFDPGRDIFVAFAPERIDPGNVAHAQSDVPRVVGGYTAECGARAAAVVGQIAPVETVSSAEAAELTKLYENTFRAVNIALANEFETITGHFGVDMAEVLRAASSKPFGFMPFRPGTGVGGHCIPCDPHYLLWQLRAMRQEAPLIDRAMTSIAHRPDEMVDRVAGALSTRGRALQGSRVMVVGVTYKPGVEDVRESPALEIIAELERRGAQVDYHDPMIPQLVDDHAGTRRSVAEPVGADYDAVIVHVIQPGDDLRWLRNCEVVIDPAGAVNRREPVALPSAGDERSPVGPRSDDRAASAVAAGDR